MRHWLAVAALLCSLSLAVGLSACAGAPAKTRISQDGETPDPREQLKAEQEKLLCHSTDEYIHTLSRLRQSKELILPERTARLVAEKVARGCDGASERFFKVLLLLKNVGVSDPRALEIALRFTKYSTEVQRNFTEIFTRAFLDEFFDYDYSLAEALALELSQDYQGDPADVRDDFIALAGFCKDGKSIELPMRTCAAYAVKLAHLSQIYPEGIRQPFITFYRKMREDRDYAMDVKTALEVSYRVLKSGPRAADNFTQAYAFALMQNGHAASRAQALEFALRMAERSFQGDRPPLIPGAIHAANP